jgi:hypothetical protein
MELDHVDHIQLGLGSGVDLGTLSTAIGGDDGEPVTDDMAFDDVSADHSSRSPAPSYARALEMGFRSAKPPSVTDGIRIDVEKATASL